METRSAAQGKPLKKPGTYAVLVACADRALAFGGRKLTHLPHPHATPTGAYNTDAYYQEKDEGFGDVGVNQEPDAGTLDDPSDPSFKPAAAELREADRTEAEVAATELPTGALGQGVCVWGGEGRERAP